MIENRWYTMVVIVFWLASMSWLCATKIVPIATWRGGSSDATPLIPAPNDNEAHVAWEIYWHSKPIGWAVYRLTPQPDASQRAHSIVHFDDLPIDRIARELFGPLADWATSHGAAAKSHLPIPMQVETQMTFDPLANSQTFVSTVHFGEIRDLFTLEGTALDGKLRVVARAAENLTAGTNEHPGVELYRGEVPLPSRMSVASSLAPLANLRDLRVGQSWMFQAYRPISLGQPLQLAEAEVVGESWLQWNGRRRRLRHVVMRYVEGSSPTAAQGPFGELWVARDGTVLKQRLWMANLSIEFVRLPTIPGRLKELR